MKVLFFMRHPGYVRNFESVLRLLAERGNQIHVAFDSTRTRWLNDANPLDQLCERYPLVTWEHSPPRGRRHRTLIPRALRLCLDYLRYLHPEYANAPKLRARAASRLPWPARFVLSSWLTRSPSRLAWIEGRLRALEKSGSVGRARLDFIGAVKPDVVLVTPYVGLGSDQVEYVRAARRLRIPSALCVASWDNLTNKGLIHEIPDLVTVWNEAQRLEAIGLHGVPAERVIATGAHSYDHWFEWTPRTDRATFCAQVGLSPEQPIVLYLCSSPFVAPIEAPFVRRWIDRLRASDGDLADAGVLVRPHPQNSAQWHDVRFDDERQVAVWPRSGADPVDPAGKSAYFDSIHHCAAVVGINTSALIESAVVGRPVHTITSDEFRDTQEGTLHFAHLVGDHGLLRVARELDEHVGQLQASLSAVRDDETELRNRRFLELFVRPHGLDQPAAPQLATAIERLAQVAVPLPTSSRRLGLGAVQSMLLLTALAARPLRPLTRRRRARAKLARTVVKLPESSYRLEKELRPPS
jgi:hypothetical protein